MRINKKLLVSIVISAGMAIAIWPIMWFAYQEFHIKPVLSKYPSGIWPWIDVDFFSMTWYAQFASMVDVAIITLWYSYGCLKLYPKLVKFFRFRFKKIKHNGTKIALLATLLATLVFLRLDNVVKAEWNVRRDVDVLCIGDEEFTAHSDWVTNVGDVLNTVNNVYSAYNIKFCIRGWQNWDSLDVRTDMIDLWQEAIQESGLPKLWIELDPDNIPGCYGWGFVSGSDWRDGSGNLWWIDLLLIFTGQEANARGLSIPRTNATIICYDSVYSTVLSHELGHQYFLEHCNNYCLMNPNNLAESFCSSCAAKLIANRDKWMTDPMIYFISRTDQGQFVSPVSYTDFIWGSWAIYFTKVKCGTTLTVRAEPLDGWILDHYYAENTPWTYTTTDPNPPPNFTVYEPEFKFTYNDTWTVLAYFNETGGTKINEVVAQNGNPAFKRGSYINIRVSLTWEQEDQPMAFAMKITDSGGQTIGFAALWCDRYVIGDSQIWFDIQIPHFAQAGEARIDCTLWTDWPWEENARRYGSPKISTIEIAE